MTWFCNIKSISIADENVYDDAKNCNIDLICGPQGTKELATMVVPSLTKIATRFSNDFTLNKESLPILGDPKFCKATTELILGRNCSAILEGRTFTIQAHSGTNALRISAEFLSNILEITNVCYPRLEMPIKLIFESGGFLNLHELRYWDKECNRLLSNEFQEDLRKAPNNAAVILHVRVHNFFVKNNPIMIWKQMIHIFREKNLFPIFFLGYQGLITGDFDNDAQIIRYFVSEGMELFCCQTFAAAFGIRDDPVGSLTIVVNNSVNILPMKSRFSNIIRGLNGRPRYRASWKICNILNNPHVHYEWKYNVKVIADTNALMKQELRYALEIVGTPGDWKFLTDQSGMIIFTGMNRAQCEILRKKYRIFVDNMGQINMCSVTYENVRYIAKAINTIVRSSVAAKIPLTSLGI